MKKKKNLVPIVEEISPQPGEMRVERTDLPEGVLARVVYPVCNIDELNANTRMYERRVWEVVLGNEDVTRKIRERCLYGQAEHPSTTASDLQLTSHIVTEMSINDEDGRVYQTFEVLDTPCGRIIETLLKAGCGVGVSTRAEGELEEVVDEAKGKYFRVVPESYEYVTTDFTADPSTFGMGAESVQMREAVVEPLKTMLDGSLADGERKFATALLESIQKTDESVSVHTPTSTTYVDSVTMVTDLTVNPDGTTSTVITDGPEEVVVPPDAEVVDDVPPVDPGAEIEEPVVDNDVLDVENGPREDDLEDPVVEESVVNEENEGDMSNAIEVMGDDRLTNLRRGQEIQVTDNELDSMLDSGSHPHDIVYDIRTKNIPGKRGHYVGWMESGDKYFLGESVIREDRYSEGNLLKNSEGKEFIVKSVTANGLTLDEMHKNIPADKPQSLSWDEVEAKGFELVSESLEKSLRDQILDLRVSESLAQAEAEIAVELLEREKAGSYKAYSRIEEIQESYGKGIARIKSNIGTSIANVLTQVQEKDSKIQELEEIHKNEISSLKEDHENEVEGLKESHARDLKEQKGSFIKEYVKRKLSESSLSLQSNSLALLENCVTIQEVDSLLDQFAGILRENALRSGADAGELKVRKVVVDRVEKDTTAVQISERTRQLAKSMFGKRR